MTRGVGRPSDRKCLLVLTGIVVLFFAPSFAFQGVLFFGDVTNYALRLAYTGEWLKAGRFPLWNPLLSLGAPHAVDIGTQAFYPLHPLLALIGSGVYDWEAAAHVLLAAVGAFGLARALELSRPAALLAGIAYAFSGFTLGHLQHLNVLVAIAWIPVVLVTTERYLATSGHRSLGFAMLALGLLILGGHPQLVLYGLLAQAAYCTFRLAALAREGHWRRVLHLGFGLLAVAAVGLALAAIFLFPFMEWMRFISRADRVTGDYATWYSLPTNRLIGFVAPFWLGGSPGRTRDAASLIEWSSYVGLLPLTLAVVAVARPSGRVLFFLGLAGGGLLLALGENTPFYGLMLGLPVFRSVRAPARFLVLVDLSLALLAACGLDALRAGAGRWLARSGAALLICFAGAVAHAAWRGGRVHVALPWRYDAVRFDQADTVVLLFALLGAASVLFALASPRGIRSPLLALALLFAVVDLLAFRAQVFFYWPAPPGAFEEPSRTAEAIRRGGGTPRFYTQTGKETESLVFDGPDFEAYRRQMWESLRTSLPMRFGFQSLTGHLTEPPAHGMLMSLIRARRQFDSRAARLAGAFGTRYVIDSPVRGVLAPELTLVARGLRSVYRNELAVPRAYLASGSRVEAGPEGALAVLKRQDFDPRRTVVIDAPGPSLPEGPLGLAEATIVGDDPDRVRIDTASDRAAWLVLNDTFAPGWSATVEGQPTKIYRANGLVRALVVGPGRHRVEFVYAPASFRWGAGLSALALFVIGVLVLPSRRTREGMSATP